MVQVIPSGTEGLGNAAAEFAAGLEKFMRPNHDFQIAMQKAIGGNPQLAQSLADLEYNAPGTLDRMGFGDLGRVISQVPESSDSQFRRKNRGEIVDAQEKQLAAQSAGYGFDLERLNDTIDYLKKNPDIKSDVVLRKLGLKTGDEKTAQAATTKHTIAETKRLEAEQPAVDLQAQLNTKKLQELVDQYPQLHGMDPMRMVKDLMRGKSVPELQSYMMLPGGSEAIGTAKQVIEFQQREDDRKIQQAQLSEYRKERLDNKTQRESTTERQNIIQAGAALRSSGRAGTLAAWRTVLEHPETVEAIRDKIKKDPKAELTQDQRDVLHAADAQDEMQESIEQRNLKTVNMNVRQAHATAADAVKKAESPAGIDLALVPLNNVLAEQGKKTGALYMAKYGPMPEIGQTEPKKGMFGGTTDGLFYVNSKGERVNDSEALTANEGQSKSAKLTSSAIAFVSQYKSANAKDQAFNLDKLKKEKRDVYDQVIQILNKK